MAEQEQFRFPVSSRPLVTEPLGRRFKSCPFPVGCLAAYARWSDFRPVIRISRRGKARAGSVSGPPDLSAE